MRKLICVTLALFAGAAFADANDQNQTIQGQNLSVKERLQVIPGNVPNPLEFPQGCKFWPRCPYAVEQCQEQEPPLETVASDHTAACWRIGQFEDVHPFMEGDSS